MSAKKKSDDQKPNVPKLRFPGFTGPWKQRKLGEISRRITRKNNDNESQLPLTISAQLGLIDQNAYFGKQIASKNLDGYYLLYNGEFAYNRSTSTDSPWGSIKRLEKHEKGCVSTLYIVFAPTDVDSQFLVTYYDTDRWYKGIQEIATEGARNHGLLNISPNDFFNTEITLPSEKNEQKRIGEFFVRVDKVITLHQRKLEHLKELKKGLLQKMFPKDGETVPELRFPGFTDPWEQCKLGEILSEYFEKCQNDGTYEHVSLTKEGVVPKTDRYDRDSLVTSEDKQYRITYLDDICYNPANLKFGVICRNRYGTSIFSPIYITFRITKDYNPGFIESLVARRDFIHRTFKWLEGTVYERTSVSPKNLLSTDVMTPSLVEQSRIADFFETVDNLITLHQRKLEHLKDLKKGLLQQMFV